MRQCWAIARLFGDISAIWKAHRTINTGGDPLVYLGISPSSAGHDHAAIARRNFRNIVVERDGVPVMISRPPLNSIYEPPQ